MTVSTAVRNVAPYSPTEDMKARYPEWDVVRVTDMPEDVGEVFLPKRKTILVARSLHDADPDYVVAHLIAHLDLHAIGGPFSHEQEMQARYFAQLRLDTAHVRNDPMCQLRLPAAEDFPPVDGDPTIPRSDLV